MTQLHEDTTEALRNKAGCPVIIGDLLTLVANTGMISIPLQEGDTVELQWTTPSGAEGELGLRLLSHVGCSPKKETGGFKHHLMGQSEETCWKSKGGSLKEGNKAACVFETGNWVRETLGLGTHSGVGVFGETKWGSKSIFCVTHAHAMNKWTVLSSC